MRRVRGGLGMGLTWAVGWTLVGMPIMLIADALPIGFDADVVDIWIPVFAYPGFLGGVTFSAVLGVGGRRRRFEDMSLSRFAGWGALGGGLLSGFIVTVAGLAPWSLVVGGIVTLLCAGSAAGSLALARIGEMDRASLDPGHVTEARVMGSEAHRPLEDRA